MNLIRKSIAPIVLAISGILTLGNWPKPNLIKHRWKNRILIVHASSEDSQKYQNQVNELSHSVEELGERKLVLYEVIGNQYKMTNYQKLENKNKWKTAKKPFQNILNENDDFKVILIGLDGGIKLEQNELLTQEELFSLIDSMPMRAAEIKGKE